MKLLSGSGADVSSRLRTAQCLAIAPVATDLAVFLGVFLVLWPTTASLLSLWEDTGNTTYTHGYLIAALSIWMLWRNRMLSAGAPFRPNPVAIGALVLMSIAWLIAFRASVQLGHQLLLPIMIATALCAIRGFDGARVQLFPIAYLCFAIPFWSSGNDILQLLTVTVIDCMLRVTAMPAFVEGNFVHLSAGVFEIAQGCSGLHFFIVALAIAALYGEVHRDKPAVRILLLAFAATLALLSNWLRVYVIILAGYLTDMQHYLVRVDHYRFGWLVFAVMMVAFFAVARRLVRSEAADRVLIAPSGAWSARKATVMLPLAVLAAAVGPLWQAAVPVEVAPLPPARSLVPSVGGWGEPQAIHATDWSPMFHGADRISRAEYWRDGSRIEVFVAEYVVQTQGKELVGWDNALFDTSQTTVLEKAQRADSTAQFTIEDSRGMRSILRYYYEVDTFRTVSETLTQFGFGLKSLLGAPVSKVVAWRSVCEPDCIIAERRLEDFAAHWRDSTTERVAHLSGSRS